MNVLEAIVVLKALVKNTANDENLVKRGSDRTDNCFVLSATPELYGAKGISFAGLHKAKNKTVTLDLSAIGKILECLNTSDILVKSDVDSEMVDNSVNVTQTINQQQTEALEEAQARISGLLARISDGEHQMTELRASITALNHAKADLTTELTAVRSSAASEKAANSSAQAKLAELQASSLAQAKQIADITLLYNEALSNASGASAAAQATISATGEAQKRIKELTIANRELERKVADLTATVVRLNAKEK